MMHHLHKKKNERAQGFRIFNTWMGDPAKIVLLEATVKTITDDSLLENVKDVGDYILDNLTQLQVGSQHQRASDETP